MCGRRRLGKNVAAAIGRVRSCVRPVCAVVKPLAIESCLTAPPRPEQNCKNDHPNGAPADPCDVRVSRLPFEDFLMDGH